jgi:hypothetical protein
VAGIYRDANDVSRRVSVAHPLQLQQPMAGLGLSVITTMDGSKAAAVTESLGVAFLLAGIAALAITSAIASRLARSISDPVVRLDETARRIANEGGVEMAGIPQVGHGEVASLSESLGKMAASLSNSRQKLEDTVRIRTRELQEANAMLDRSAGVHERGCPAYCGEGSSQPHGTPLAHAGQARRQAQVHADHRGNVQRADSGGDRLRHCRSARRNPHAAPPDAGQFRS